MIGAIIIAIVVVIVIPVGLFLTGAIATGVIGTLLKTSAEDAHEGSELIDLNQ